MLCNDMLIVSGIVSLNPNLKARSNPTPEKIDVSVPKVAVTINLAIKIELLETPVE